MKYLFIFFPIIIFSQNIQLEKMFERASNNEMSCDSLLNFCMNEMTIKEKYLLETKQNLRRRNYLKYLEKFI